MLNNYFVIALRNFRRQKGYAAVNVVGLAVGMACCLWIFLLGCHEWNCDAFHAEADPVRTLRSEQVPLSC